MRILGLGQECPKCNGHLDASAQIGDIGYYIAGKCNKCGFAVAGEYGIDIDRTADAKQEEKAVEEFRFEIMRYCLQPKYSTEEQAAFEMLIRNGVTPGQFSRMYDAICENKRGQQ